jgi:ABC-type branched-subunit amino acid transport system substrate-binding protein
VRLVSRVFEAVASRTVDLLPRRRVLAVAVALFALGACSRGDVTGPVVVATPEVPAQPQGEVLGNGPVTVALLLPLSAGGEASGLAQSFKNAASLAISENPSVVRVLVKDDGGSEAGARAAAQQAIGEGARLILGPVFAPAVAGAASVTRPAGLPVVAFSTRADLASRNVYLLSFLPQGDIDRVVSYAASVGKRNFAAIVPANDYGGVAIEALSNAAARVGGRVVGFAQYNPNRSDLATAAQTIAGYGSQVDAVLVPEGGSGAGAVAAALRGAGIATGQVQLLGTGQWDDPAIAGDPNLAGALYPAPERGAYEAYLARYRARFGSVPPRTASLAYDGATLAVGLVKAVGPAGFSENNLANPSGFIGVNGLFRFTQNGLSQRGLAIYQVSGGAVRIVSPAPRSFAPGT